ncbi:hypothetical protein GOB33_24570 [Sinorhizobium meliloti]|nr:hypothetical protein [Sinorhizobium meliloti]MDW9651241.1 hypothetical protein [Sinorhizobium meliloti]
MTSIVTNSSSLAALQTLRSIHWQLSATQGQVSSGQSVATASDNAAYWSISRSSSTGPLLAGLNRTGRPRPS